MKCLTPSVFCRIFCVPLSASLGFALGASAESVRYVIDAEQSFLRVVEGEPNGNVFEGFAVQEGSRIATTFALIEREPGSLVVPLGGFLHAERTGDVLTFSGGNRVAAQANPGGPFPPSPAETGSTGLVDNFGGFGAFAAPANRPIEFAVRDAIADVIGGSATIGAPPTDLSFDLNSGIVDYRLDANIASLFGAPELGFLNIPDLIDPVLNESPAVVTESPAGVLEISLALDFPFSAFGPDDSLFVLEGNIVAAPILAGDFNGDRSVDARDYALWREALAGSDGVLNGAGTGDDSGLVVSADFDLWRANYGRSATVEIQSTPEPPSVGLVLAISLLRTRKQVA